MSTGPSSQQSPDEATSIMPMVEVAGPDGVICVWHTSLTRLSMGPEETLENYLHRLVRAFNTHSGLSAPDNLVLEQNRGAPSGGRRERQGQRKTKIQILPKCLLQLSRTDLRLSSGGVGKRNGHLQLTLRHLNTWPAFTSWQYEHPNTNSSDKWIWLVHVKWCRPNWSSYQIRWS